MKTLAQFNDQIKRAGSGFSAPRHQILQTEVLIELLVDIRSLLDEIAHGPKEPGQQQ